MAEDRFFCEFLDIFEHVSDTVLDQIDMLPEAFDANIAPPTMVREMSRWLGNDWLGEHHEVSEQRTTVRNYPPIIRRRGTKRGVTEMIELVTGPGTVTVSDSGGVYDLDEASHPAPTATIDITSATWTPTHQLVGWASTDDLVRIVADEIPASVELTLRINTTTVWTRDRGAPARTETEQVDDHH